MSTGETDWNHQGFKDATENTLLEGDSNEEEVMSLEEIDNQNGIFRLQSSSYFLPSICFYLVSAVLLFRLSSSGRVALGLTFNRSIITSEQSHQRRIPMADPRM